MCLENLLYTPDTLSRAPVSTAEERDKVFQTEAEMFAMAAVANLPAMHNDWNLTSLPS